MQNLKKSKTILIWVFIINILLVSTHLGEFWPFSIFPMFSQAGNQWSRGVVEQIEDRNRDDLWETKSLEEVRDRVIPLKNYGINVIDYANFISKTEDWNEKRVQALRDMFEMDQKEGKQWMATRVTGYLTEGDSVVVKAIPMFLLTADTTYRNPGLVPK